MIAREHELPIARQAQLLELSRASVYYRPVAISAADLQLMRRIDELHLELPFAGSRMLRDLLNPEGHRVGRKHVRTLMRRMGIEAIYSFGATSHPITSSFRILSALLRRRPRVAGTKRVGATG